MYYTQQIKKDLIRKIKQKTERELSKFNRINEEVNSSNVSKLATSLAIQT